MQNDSFKMRQHYAPYNRSEESHRVSEEYIFYGKPPSREIASLRSQRQYIRLVNSSVGYFACAQYDGKSPIVGFAATSPEGGSEALRHSER